MPKEIPEISISKAGERRLATGHVWVYRADLLAAAEQLPSGPVHVFGQRGRRCLGTALYSAKSSIALRLLARERIEPGLDWLCGKLAEARALRERAKIDSDAWRLVHGEADGLPSIVVDNYAGVLAVQTLSAGAEALKERLYEALQKTMAPAAVVERNDAAVRELEGLPRVAQVVAGRVPEPLLIREGELRFAVDVLKGQKTGGYLDQRDNRRLAGQWARGRALDLFCYQGGFSLPLARNCQEVIAVDSSAEALAALQGNAERNGLKNVVPHAANGFDFLRQWQTRGERFDAIVLDPPPFVKRKDARDAGMRGYKEVALRALKMLHPGGLLITCSCSHHLSWEDLFSITLTAAVDAGRTVQVLSARGAGPDHPILLGVPETEYLRCLFCVVR